MQEVICVKRNELIRTEIENYVYLEIKIENNMSSHFLCFDCSIPYLKDNAEVIQ